MKKLSWGNQQHIDLVSGGTPFDIILGSDILYNPDLTVLSNLAKTLRKLSGLGTIALIASPDASLDGKLTQEFYAQLEQDGFAIEDISEQPEVAELRVLSGYSTFEHGEEVTVRHGTSGGENGRGPVRLIRMRRLRLGAASSRL